MKRQVLGAAIGISGFVVIWAYAGFLPAIGVLLAMWGNNIQFAKVSEY